MLFVFRGIRVFQVIAAVVALVLGITLALALKEFSDSGNVLALVGGFVLGLAFLFMFAVALRAPTSFVAVADDRTRIRFAGFIDTVVDNRDILGVALIRRNPLHGLGVRLTFPGIALLSAWGTVAEIHLRVPVRVWLIPKLIPLRTTRLAVSIRNPAKLAERFGPPTASASPSPGKATARRMKNRGSRTR